MQWLAIQKMSDFGQGLNIIVKNYNVRDYKESVPRYNWSKRLYLRIDSTVLKYNLIVKVLLKSLALATSLSANTSNQSISLLNYDDDDHQIHRLNFKTKNENWRISACPQDEKRYCQYSFKSLLNLEN